MNTIGILFTIALPSFACGVSIAAWTIRSPWQVCELCDAVGRQHAMRCRSCAPSGNVWPSLVASALAERMRGKSMELRRKSDHREAQGRDHDANLAYCAALQWEDAADMVADVSSREYVAR